MISRLLLVVVSGLLTGLTFLHSYAVWQEHPLQLFGIEWFSWTAHDLACGRAATCSVDDYVSFAAEAPLNAEPFSMMLRRTLERDETTALALAEQVFWRDPRSVDARIVLANHALQEGDVDGFGYYYFPLFNIMRHDQRRFAEPLVVLSENPEVFSQVAERLQTTPSWGQEYLLSALGTKSPPFARLASLFDHYPELRGHFLSSMVRQDQTAEAYAYFVSSLSGEDAGRLGVPYNAQLRPSDAPRPFNWHIVSTNAEFLERGGLFVYHTGAKTERFLQQIVPMSDGRHRLTVSFEMEGDEHAASLEWRIGCLLSNQEIVRLELKTSQGQAISESVDFEVPAGVCRFQTLSLQGKPGRLAKPVRTTVSEVSITSVAREP